MTMNKIGTENKTKKNYGNNNMDLNKPKWISIIILSETNIYTNKSMQTREDMRYHVQYGNVFFSLPNARESWGGGPRGIEKNEII